MHATVIGQTLKRVARQVPLKLLAPILVGNATLVVSKRA
jgi:hypothetical protein